MAFFDTLVATIQNNLAGVRGLVPRMVLLFGKDSAGEPKAIGVALDGSALVSPAPGSGMASDAELALILAKLSSDPATQTTLAAILAKIIASPATEASLASLKSCTHTEAVVPGDATVVAYRVICCTAAGNLTIKATSDAAATTWPMTAGEKLASVDIVRVMAATTGSYVAGW